MISDTGYAVVSSGCLRFAIGREDITLLVEHFRSEINRRWALAVDEYLEYKRAKGKRSVRHDEYRLRKIKAWFGADTPITEVTAQRIAPYDRARVTEKSRRKRPVTVNRELSILRHLLRLGEEWGYIEKVPRIHARLGDLGTARVREP